MLLAVFRPAVRQLAGAQWRLVVPYGVTIGDGVKHLAALPLLFNPGDKFEYSLGVDVLGRFVEVVSGKPLESLNLGSSGELPNDYHASKKD